MDRYICIHGHFYQPPRENPWLETIEVQDSAYPYHDWNARITAECYEPNAFSRILDGDGRIIKIANNYAGISFNYGPTVMAWLEEHAPQTYRRIIEADTESSERFSGHGSALAQAYNHMIMPLANRRDKYTQTLWGIRDFKHRFGRMPLGMWLPETAVDLETLDVLSELGIKFTILAPNQASQVRKFRGRTWHDVSGSRIDPTTPYEVRLPSRRKMIVFFYDGPISRAVAFEGLLSRGEHLANRLASGFSDERDGAQLVHIATDGESYGHHHRQGEMALAYALEYITTNGLAKLTNYAEFLSQHPPTSEARIFENSSWSCVHGVERWRSNCGCNSGGHGDWNQLWREPLRNALDWLRDALATRFEAACGKLLKDPWAARNDYISIILDRSPASVARFFKRHAKPAFQDSDASTVLKLLEMQRQCMLMYTSCGWFFDELSGLETVQVIQYAGRAVQLAEDLFGEPFEPGFLERLDLAKSNLAEHRDGRRIYEEYVKSAMVDLAKVGAHFAVSSLFETYEEKNKIFCYTADVGDFKVHEAGAAKLAVGRARITSDITRDAADLSFGVIHFGDHNLHGGVARYAGEDVYQQFVSDVVEPFERGEFPEVVSLLDRKFEASTYSLRSLFRDEQRKILDVILDTGSVEQLYRQVYQQHAPLMRFYSGLDAPVPKVFRTAAEFILNFDLRAALSSPEPDLAHIRQLLNEARLWQVELETAGLGYQLIETVDAAFHRLNENVDDLEALQRLERLAEVPHNLPFPVNLASAQNTFFEMRQNVYAEMQRKAEAGDAQARQWVEHFRSLGGKLTVHI